jgi:TPR repeat protein
MKQSSGIRLAATKYGPAQNNLGVMYQNGRGVQKDYNEAVKLYQLAAKHSYAMAQYNLGLMYTKPGKASRRTMFARTCVALSR